MMVGELRAQLVAAGVRLASVGLVRGSEGNLSARIDREKCLVTPTGSVTGRLGAGELLVMPIDGSDTPERVTSEAELHLELYRRRPEVMAIVHAHPPMVLRLAEAGQIPDEHPLEKGERVFGQVVDVEHFEEGSLELAGAVATALSNTSACVLRDHGAVTLGTDVEQALRRMLLLERAAVRMDRG
jgi:L-fuculose-phosphate aldolase